MQRKLLTPINRPLSGLAKKKQQEEGGEDIRNHKSNSSQNIHHHTESYKSNFNPISDANSFLGL